jgi:tetrahydromethanopterin S-methyltransferase subunit G
MMNDIDQEQEFEKLQQRLDEVQESISDPKNGEFLNRDL